MIKPRGRAVRGLLAGGTLAVVGLWAMFLRPVALGGPSDYLVIRGDSMEPTYHSGDLVVVEAQASYEPGEIVAYRVPAGQLGAGLLVIHRLVGEDGGGFVVQGDNNPAPDPWTPASTDIVGRAWIVIPGAGRVLAFLHQPAVAGALAAALFVSFAAWHWGKRPATAQDRPGRETPLPVPSKELKGWSTSRRRTRSGNRVGASRGSGHASTSS